MLLFFAFFLFFFYVQSAPEVSSPSGRFSGNLIAYALDRYAYYPCQLCQTPFFGGQRRCDDMPGGNGAALPPGQGLSDSDVDDNGDGSGGSNLDDDADDDDDDDDDGSGSDGARGDSLDDDRGSDDAEDDSGSRNCRRRRRSKRLARKLPTNPYPRRIDKALRASPAAGAGAGVEGEGGRKDGNAQFWSNALFSSRESIFEPAAGGGKAAGAALVSRRLAALPTDALLCGSCSYARSLHIQRAQQQAARAGGGAAAGAGASAGAAGAMPVPLSCPRHGAEYMENKCRFCCSIAAWFCWGTVRFSPLFLSMLWRCISVSLCSLDNIAFPCHLPRPTFVTTATGSRTRVCTYPKSRSASCPSVLACTRRAPRRPARSGSRTRPMAPSLRLGARSAGSARITEASDD
jgi:hypothetical protein